MQTENTEHLIAGKRYPLVINSTRDVTSLHYAFKPGDLDEEKEGKLTFSSESDIAIVELSRKSRSDVQSNLVFKGYSDLDGAGKDFALIFDHEKKCFELCRIKRSINGLKPRELL